MLLFDKFLDKFTKRFVVAVKVVYFSDGGFADFDKLLNLPVVSPDLEKYCD